MDSMEVFADPTRDQQIGHLAVDEKPFPGEPQLDRKIIEALPAGGTILAVEPYGTSSWASTARIETERADGSRKDYFLKLVKAHDAAERVFGEYMSMAEIYKTLPSIAPQPHGYGKLERQDAYFFVCDYLSIDHELPDPVRLGKKLAELHHKSQSPTGKFGFHCTTFDGMLPLNTTWDSSWTSFFKTLFLDVYKLDLTANGFWKELDDVVQVTVEKLIPRLLDALTAEGRTIKPSLIHGDLWESNIGTDVETGEIYIYDACAYYAHHEKEVGIWRVEHHQLHGEEYRNEYFKNVEPSEPLEEFDDRNRLYAVETLLINSAVFPGAETRRRALDDLKWLINKYQDDL